MTAYMQYYKQHFNQTLSQHAAAFQVEMDLARSEASNRALQQENESKRQQLLYQQSARYYQLLLLVLLAVALILLSGSPPAGSTAARHLYKLATFDQLTGLPNRRALLETGSAMAARNAPDPAHHRHRLTSNRSTTSMVTRRGSGYPAVGQGSSRAGHRTSS